MVDVALTRSHYKRGRLKGREVPRENNIQDARSLEKRSRLDFPTETNRQLPLGDTSFTKHSSDVEVSTAVETFVNSGENLIIISKLPFVIKNLGRTCLFLGISLVLERSRPLRAVSLFSLLHSRVTAAPAAVIRPSAPSLSCFVKPIKTSFATSFARSSPLVFLFRENISTFIYIYGCGPEN